MKIPGHKTRTDWDRVNREYDSGVPIPYDPNDDAAVEAYWKQATIWKGYPNPVLIQKDGVPCYPDSTPREVPKADAAQAEVIEPSAKAS